MASITPRISNLAFILPKFAFEQAGLAVYMRLVGWQTARDDIPAPADFVGWYLGTDGYVEDRADAIDFAGTALSPLISNPSQLSLPLASLKELATEADLGKEVFVDSIAGEVPNQYAVLGFRADESGDGGSSTLVALTDTPSAISGGQLLAGNAAGTAVVFVPRTFTGLTDTPAAVSPGQILAGNADGDAVEFVERGQTLHYGAAIPANDLGRIGDVHNRAQGSTVTQRLKIGNASWVDLGWLTHATGDVRYAALANALNAANLRSLATGADVVAISAPDVLDHLLLFNGSAVQRITHQNYYDAIRDGLVTEQTGDGRYRLQSLPISSADLSAELTTLITDNLTEVEADALYAVLTQGLTLERLRTLITGNSVNVVTQPSSSYSLAMYSGSTIVRINYSDLFSAVRSGLITQTNADVRYRRSNVLITSSDLTADLVNTLGAKIDTDTANARYRHQDTEVPAADVETGTSDGEIPIIGAGDKLPASIIPGGSGEALPVQEASVTITTLFSGTFDSDTNTPQLITLDHDVTDFSGGRLEIELVGNCREDTRWSALIASDVSLQAVSAIPVRDDAAVGICIARVDSLNAAGSETAYIWRTTETDQLFVSVGGNRLDGEAFILRHISEARLGVSVAGTLAPETVFDSDIVIGRYVEEADNTGELPNRVYVSKKWNRVVGDGEALGGEQVSWGLTAQTAMYVGAAGLGTGAAANPATGDRAPIPPIPAQTVRDLVAVPDADIRTAASFVRNEDTSIFVGRLGFLGNPAYLGKDASGNILIYVDGSFGEVDTASDDLLPLFLQRIESVVPPSTIPSVEMSADRSLALGDEGRQVSNGSTARTLTFEADATVPTDSAGILRAGSAVLTLAAGTGATINQPANTTLTMTGEHNVASWIRVGDTDTYIIRGDLDASS